MPTRDIRCPACRRPLTEDPATLNSLDRCPACNAPLTIATFPGFRRVPVAGRPAERITGEGEAACFFHASRKAAVPCDDCGRFLCALCDIPVDGRHLCPTCIDTAHKTGTVRGLERSRTRWDAMVWYANLGLFTVVGIPFVTLFNILVTIFRWSAADSRVANVRRRMILGTLVSILACGGLATLILVAFVL
jgi:hypothetical protein